MEERKRKMIGLNIVLILIVLVVFGFVPFVSKTFKFVPDSIQFDVAHFKDDSHWQAHLSSK